MYKIQSFLPEEPILIISYLGERVEQDIPASSAEIAQMLDGIEGPIYRIVDFTKAKIDFAVLVEGLARSTRKDPGTFSDPRMRPIFVGTQEMVRFGAESASQDHYGNLKIMVVGTREEALAYARQQIAAGNGQ